MTLARFIKTEGPYLEALLEVEGQPLRVMDEFSADKRALPKAGEEIEFEFSPSVSGHESWEEIFSGNPDQKIGLENVDGWCYHAYGQIVAIGPVKVNCGLFVVEDVIHTNDPKVVGEYVRFTISCLGGYAHAIQVCVPTDRWRYGAAGIDPAGADQRRLNTALGIKTQS